MTAAPRDDQPSFGGLVRKHRLALGFRRAPYRETVRDLAAALELNREDTAALEASVSRRRHASTSLGDGMHPQLPEPTFPLIGRDREAADIQASLRRHRHGRAVRLLTLLGPGGVGKTHLALHVATDLAQHYADGAVFVPLAPLQNAELVASALAQALQVPEAPVSGPLESVKRRLRQANTLLVLDNFEHVMDAALLLADLMAVCPGVQFLVTSRARLHLSGEHVYLVPPLGLPDLTTSRAPAELLNSPAVALLIERARAAGVPTEYDAPGLRALGAICRQLDGLPLAIQLAAPRLRVLSPEVLLARLNEPLGVLDRGARDLPERQRTLRATLDWSYELLDPDIRTVLRRLSVVSGNCSLETAEAVSVPADQDVDEYLAVLLDQSLLTAQTGVDNTQRFGMLETVRAYAFERLVEAGEVDETRGRHARHFRDVVERAQEQLEGPHQAEQLARLDQERDNIRAALGWSVEHDPVLAQGLAAGLSEYWHTRGLLAEGREWLRRSLEVPATEPGRDAALHTGSALLALEQSDIDQADRLAKRGNRSGTYGWR